MKIDLETMKIMALFEKVTRARLKDCITNDNLLFIVYPNQSGIAIGKNGINIKKIERLLKKKAVVKEYSEDKIQFVKNLINVEVEGIEEIDGVIEIKTKDNQSRSILIGRDKQNLKHLEEVVKRHFDIDEVKVV